MGDYGELSVVPGEIPPEKIVFWVLCYIQSGKILWDKMLIH